MKSLTLIVPSHNDADRLANIMEALNSFKKLKGVSLSEVMFIDDASSDTTLYLLKRAQKTILRRFQRHFPKTKITLISYTQKRGKGFATALGMRTSTSDYTISIDPSTISLSHLNYFFPFMKKNAQAIFTIYPTSKPTKKDTLALVSFHLVRFAEKILCVRTLKGVGTLNIFSKKAKALFSKTTTTRTLSLTELTYWAAKQHISFQKIKLTEKNPTRYSIENTLYDIYELSVLFWFYMLKPYLEAQYADFQKTVFYKHYGARLITRLL